MKDAVKLWGKTHIFIDVDNLKLQKDNYYFKNCKNIEVENSTVTAWENSIICLPNNSSNKKENIILMENSTLKDCKTKTIYQSGNWKLITI